MKILVTGGAGYIGSHACKALAEAGHVPITFDNLSTGHRDAVRWGPLFAGDILDADALSAAFRTHRPEAVMHFAALAYVGESFRFPARYYRTNVTGTHQLLQAMLSYDCGDIVFSSSCATYGIPTELPITEECRQDPINPYGLTKLVAERMLADYRTAYGLRSVCLRYFNAAGADPDGLLGERHDPETHAIPLAIDAAITRERPFSILGTDYPTPDGTAIRDYVHVSDLADAHVRALERLAGGDLAPAYNLATGRGISVREIVTAVEHVTGAVVPTIESPRRPGDPPSLYAEANRAHRDLGWSPRFVDIETIVETAVRWTMANRPMPEPARMMVAI
jgi:UDP-arabinose 4-epimerase